MTGPQIDATRCPFCHDQVRDDERAASRVCEACLARHHGECWEGACASCGGERALQVAEHGADRRFARVKAAASWGYLASFALFMVTLPIASALYPPQADPPLLAMLPMGLCAGLSMLMWALGSYDAILRRDRDPSLGTGAMSLAFLSPLTGGITGFAYFLLHGRRPLPPRGGSSPPRVRAMPQKEKEKERSPGERERA
jgi:hypothetical protein